MRPEIENRSASFGLVQESEYQLHWVTRAISFVRT